MGKPTIGVYTVSQQKFAVIERFGKFARITGPGFHFAIPLVESIAGQVTIRVRELNVKINTKTKDNVFVDLLIAVQFFVDGSGSKEGKQNIWNSFYKLTNEQAQMESWIYDTVRAKVPTMDLDNVFENKEDIANDIEASLDSRLNEYGYKLVRALVNDIQPDEGVASAMNEINRQQRLRVAAEAEGEAKKILIVKAAEADAESKRLSGQGIADQRKAIVEGLRESVKEASDSLGVAANDVMSLVLLTQYYDMLTDVGRNSNSNTIMLPHSPGAVGDLKEQIIAAFIAGTGNKQVSPES